MFVNTFQGSLEDYNSSIRIIKYRKAKVSKFIKYICTVYFLFCSLFSLNMGETCTGFIPTRASLLKNSDTSNYQEVSYVSYKSKKKKDLKNEESNTDANILKKFDARKIKHEIVKFSVEGFDKEKKEEIKKNLAIKLGKFISIDINKVLIIWAVGAKPPRNKCKNYKQLLIEKKREKKKLEAEQKFQQLGKNAVGKSLAKGKSYDRKRKKDGILDVYGKVTKELRQLKSKRK